MLASKARLLAPLLGTTGPGRAALVSDLAAEIEWAKARGHTPERYAAAAIAAGRHTADGAGARSPTSTPATKPRSASGGVATSTTCSAGAPTRSSATRRSRPPSAGGSGTCSSTSSRTRRPLQLRLLRAWLGDRTDLCVVGDAAQAIYAFAGADAAPLTDFARHFPGGRVVALDRNYRSTPQIVDVAEGVLGPRPASSGRRCSRCGPRPSRPSVRAFADDDAEAAAVAQGCWEAFVEGVPWDRIAVLFRTNAQSARFEAACARRGVPCPDPERRALRRTPGRAHAARRAAHGGEGGARPRRSPTTSPT